MCGLTMCANAALANAINRDRIRQLSDRSVQSGAKAGPAYRCLPAGSAKDGCFDRSSTGLGEPLFPPMFEAVANTITFVPGKYLLSKSTDCENISY